MVCLFCSGFECDELLLQVLWLLAYCYVAVTHVDVCGSCLGECLLFCFGIALVGVAQLVTLLVLFVLRVRFVHFGYVGFCCFNLMFVGCGCYAWCVIDCFDFVGLVWFGLGLLVVIPVMRGCLTFALILCDLVVGLICLLVFELLAMTLVCFTWVLLVAFGCLLC